MAIAVEVPQLGNTVEECILTRWIKRTGDAVSAGDIVAEIETDKTSFEIQAPVDGVVLATFFDEGALMPVFTTMCVIGEAGEAIDSFRPGAAAGDAPPPLADDQPQTRAAPFSSSAVAGGVPGMSPRARKLAAARGVTPPSRGSGPGGRIIERDIQQALASRPAAARSGGGTRLAMARRMRESLASTAQYTLNASARATGLLGVRARMKASSRPDITIGDLVAYCTIRALVSTPALNAEFIDGRLVSHDEVHLGFAVDTPHGLLAPVVRDAHRLDLAALASRMHSLAEGAIAGTLGPDLLTGATFTISNLGSLGVESFTPVLNPPQVAILGVGAIQLRPFGGADGQVGFIDTIGLSLTCDHQVIDGAPGARFLQHVRTLIEGIESMNLANS